jgi:hypothetical protein
MKVNRGGNDLGPHLGQQMFHIRSANDFVTAGKRLRMTHKFTWYRMDVNEQVVGHLEGNLVRLVLGVLEVTRDCHMGLKYSYCSSKQRLLTATKTMSMSKNRATCEWSGEGLQGLVKMNEGV